MPDLPLFSPLWFLTNTFDAAFPWDEQRTEMNLVLKCFLRLYLSDPKFCIISGCHLGPDATYSKPRKVPSNKLTFVCICLLSNQKLSSGFLGNLFPVAHIFSDEFQVAFWKKCNVTFTMIWKPCFLFSDNIWWLVCTFWRGDLVLFDVRYIKQGVTIWSLIISTVILYFIYEVLSRGGNKYKEITFQLWRWKFHIWDS